MLRGLLRLDRAVAVLERWAIGIALATMLCAVVLNVLDRSFAWPLPDLSEVAIGCMSVLAFVGGAWAVREQRHIAVELRHVVAGGPGGAIGGLLVDVAVVAFSGAILVYGWPFLAYVHGIGERTPELDLPIAIPVGCLLAGAALSILHVACRWLERLDARRPASCVEAVGR